LPHSYASIGHHEVWTTDKETTPIPVNWLIKTGITGIAEEGFTMEHIDELTVFDPRGRVDAERVELAPRAMALKGLRLGILDNTKWNANRLLRKTAALLEAEHGIGSVNYYKKESFSKSADAALIAEIAAGNDIVLTAIGD
jgi:hypothetical protein